MIKYENECCGCATENYPCLGSSCPNRNVKHLYCDECKNDVELLYNYGSEELCEDCLKNSLERITLFD